jgi:transcription elongation factor GreA
MTRDDLRATLQRELAHLAESEHPRLLALMGTVEGTDTIDQADRALIEQELASTEGRIARLRDQLATVDAAARSDGGTGAWSTVVVDFGDGPEAYLLADFTMSGRRVITRGSPLGKALSGARGGQTVTYLTPRGRAAVRLLAVDGVAAPHDGQESAA